MDLALLSRQTCGNVSANNSALSIPETHAGTNGSGIICCNMAPSEIREHCYRIFLEGPPRRTRCLVRFAGWHSSQNDSAKKQTDSPEPPDCPDLPSRLEGP